MSEEELKEKLNQVELKLHRLYLKGSNDEKLVDRRRLLQKQLREVCK